MISKLALKRRLKLLLVLAGLVAALAAVNSLAGLFRYFQTGADPASVFVQIPLLPAGQTASLSWLPSPGDTGRTMDSTTREIFTADYARAWDQLQRAVAQRNTAGLADNFTGPALSQAQTAVADARSRRAETAIVDVSHSLQLRMFSADGTLASIRDTAEVVRDTPLGGAGDVTDSLERYVAIIALQDGSWHIRQLVRESARVRTAQSPIAPATDTLSAPLAGVNYYPRSAPWEKMWTAFPADEIRHDLGHIRALGVSWVRAFIPFEIIGAGQDATYLARMQAFLAMAHQQHLSVLVTLFDGRTDHALVNWAADDRYLATVVPALAGRPGLGGWDLKNEPDLDYGRPAPRPIVDAWLAHVARTVRADDHRSPLTIGWSSAQAAEASPLRLDFVSFHDYLDPRGARARFAAVRRDASGRPVVLEEFGETTYQGLLAPGHSEADQAWYYAQILRAVRSAGLSGWMAWTLNDFTSGPPGVRWPWIVHPQEAFGLVRPNGTERPAALLLAPGANLGLIHAPGALARWTEPFRVALLGALALLAGMAAGASSLWWRRRRRQRAAVPAAA